MAAFSNFICCVVAAGASEAAGEGQAAGAWEQRVQRQKSAPAAGYRGTLALGRQNTGPGGAGAPAPFGRTVSPPLAQLAATPREKLGHHQSCPHTAVKDQPEYKAPLTRALLADDGLCLSNPPRGPS